MPLKAEIVDCKGVWCARVSDGTVRGGCIQLERLLHYLTVEGIEVVPELTGEWRRAGIRRRELTHDWHEQESDILTPVSAAPFH